ncbi:GNAT family N-acetyltransferase; N-acetyltransferase [Peredibacter sp. HCB2-198]|uniref:GNAT family N-acetyltransferase n=1 Tax=Peredibacter sp. HCB2-198 TaxID=3383025 RepID=UPI0038B59A29
MTIRLESKRLYYEHLEEKHFEGFCRQESDPEVMKYIRAASEDREAARKKFNDYLSYMSAHPKLGMFAVFEKETQNQIGLGVLFHIEMKPETGRYEVGYRFDQTSWGKGYATELTHRLLQYGFYELGLKEICGTTDPKNLVSQKVLMKAGMKNMGITTEFRTGSQFFVLNRDEYHPSDDYKS